MSPTQAYTALRFRQGMPWLTGANCCITNCIDDYKHTFIPLHGTHNIDGLGKGLHIAGKGFVTWTFKAEDGSYRDMMIPCYYVPSCHARILSTQTFLRYYPKETISMNNRNLRLSGDEYNQPITVPYCPESHLPVAPIVMTARGVRTDKDDTPIGVGFGQNNSMQLISFDKQTSIIN